MRRSAILTVFILLALVAGIAPELVAGNARAESTDAQRSRANQGTVTIISGGVNGTYIRIASDLATVLDRGDDLRILPVVGKGSVQNITDLLYLRGIDVAIVQSDVLSFIRKRNLVSDIGQRIRYITKLYNEEVHILGRPNVSRIEDLADKKVNVDVAGSGTAMTAATLFGALGIAIQPTNFDQALALEKLKAGEIEAMIFVAGKPTDLFRTLDGASGLHFVSVPLTPALLDTYLPSALTHGDYPQLIGDGVKTETVAVGSVMAVYNWDRQSDRYRRVATFVDAFFNNFDQFLKPPRHPKWRDVNLAATLPGWTRFQPAEDWLNRRPSALANSGNEALRTSFAEFLRFIDETGGVAGHPATPQSREALFARFVEWRLHQQESEPAPSSPSR